MRLLLDSHVFLWWRCNDGRLTTGLIQTVLNAAEVYISAATAWELGLKIALGKLRLPEAVEDAVADAGFRELPVRFEHTRAAVGLPFHHRDPFDRLLLAQARCEGLVLVTHDRAMAPYGVPLLWVD